MKLKKSYTSIFAATALTLGAIATMIQPSSAQRTTTYFCGTSNDGHPTTFARTATGKRIAIIRWEKKWDNEYTPQVRCNVVSGRFQQGHENGVLNYITSGEINGYPIVCAARRYGEACSQMLLTLRKNDNPNEVIQGLIGVAYRAEGPLVQTEDGDPKIFIDINKFLRQAPAEEEN